MQEVKMCIDWFHVESIVKKYGFRLTDSTLSEMKNGWLELIVNWEVDKDSHLFKYCYSNGTMFSSDCTVQHLRFTNLPKNFKASLDIGIQVKNLNEHIKYSVEYFNNLGHGVAVYFSPDGWQENSKVLDTHNFSAV